jgi:hypothetical protein
MASGMIDEIKRMKDITQALAGPGVTHDVIGCSPRHRMPFKP